MTIPKISKTILEEAVNKVDPSGWDSVYNVLELIIRRMERDVLDIDINSKSFSQLAMMKAKSDGGTLLLKRLKGLIEKANRSSLDD